MIFSNSSYISQAIGFRNPETGWVGGSRLTNAPIYYTVNGGGVFDTVRWGRNITSIVFVNDTIAFASGFSVYKFSNGTDVGIGNNIEEIGNYYLSQNYPNPFNPVTNIKFEIPKTSYVRISVYDISGREIDVPVNEQLQAGAYSITWNGALHSSGIYFYRMKVDGFSDTKRMILIK